MDFVFRVPFGRKLEDRVLDALRVWQAALNSGVEASTIRFVPWPEGGTPDEFMIAERLLEQGLGDRLC